MKKDKGFVNKRLLKKEPQLKIVVNTKQVQPNNYHSIYFKQEVEQDRRNLFFR